MVSEKPTSQTLKNLGLKVTVPRVKVLEILIKNKNEHISAETIFKRLLDAGEEVGIATIYRVLTQFEAHGLVVKHRFDAEHAVFELNKGQHHDHIVCTECGHVEEFIDPVIEDRQKKVAERHGFTISDHCLYLYGVCAKCQEKAKADQ